MEKQTGIKNRERPSLYTEVIPQNGHGVTLLGALEPRSTPRWRKKHAAALLLVVVAGPLLYAALARYAIKGDAVLETSLVQATPEVTHTAEPLAETSKSTPALIVNEAVWDVETPQETAKNESRPSEVEASGKSPEKKTNVTAAVSHPTSASRSTATVARKDRDVDLIAALLAYAQPVSAAKSTSASHPGKAVSVPSNDPTHDIVTKTGGESIDSLVKRCRALGWLEGELCRFRVCSGMWGKDAACPAGSNQSAEN